MPVQPSPYDVWATEHTVVLIREAQELQDDLTAGFDINRKIANTVIVRDIVRALDHFELLTLAVHLGQRVLYAESARRGLSVVEAVAWSEAAREIAELVFSLIRSQAPASRADEARAAA